MPVNYIDLQAFFILHGVNYNSRSALLYLQGQN